MQGTFQMEEILIKSIDAKKDLDEITLPIGHQAEERTHNGKDQGK